MINKKWNWIALALGLVLISSLLMNGLMYQQLPRTAYVDIHEVFEKFAGTKELKLKAPFYGNQPGLSWVGFLAL